MDLKKVIDRRDDAAQYMIDEITHICTKIEKRAPGSEGEKKACEYMAAQLKDLGCDEVKVESFKENPGSFYGWIYITISLCIIAAIAYLLGAPWLTIPLIIIGLTLCVLQFGLYKKAIDGLFKEKTGHNVTAIKKCTGETKRRIVFNGHPDATWEWPVNYALGGVAFEGHAILCFVGAFLYLILAILKLAGVGSPEALTKAGLFGLVFFPIWFGLYFMVNYKIVVDGANDNLSGCYMGIAILKYLKEEGIALENTEIGVVLTGSEECGLRGSMAWCEAHKGEYDDVPTFIYAYDTIYDPKYLMANYRDLNATVKTDKDANDLFMEAAEAIGVHCSKGMVPPLGGATDSAAFAKAGFRAAGITGLNHKLERYYHTRRDTYDNMNAKGLADCYAASVKVLEMFDNGAKQ